jgi:tRNA A-37 threonylcarbamoyl transferase component Bud32
VESEELAGRRLADRYLLEEPVASGGMATVWKASDEVLGRPVAVKILREELARDPDLLERFRMEAVAAARLSHPAVVRIFDTGVDDGVCYIVMELQEGRTLADILEPGPLSPAEAVRIASAALQGLAHAHREGVVHRDVKPSNILIGPSGVKVTDFGIAKAAFTGGDVTTTGNLLGTAKYLAPEQVDGNVVDGRADIYAVGLVLYEALTGRTPFEAETHLATATMRLTKDPSPPGSLRPGIPRAVEAVVLKALARHPEERYQSAEEMSAALDRAAPTPSAPHRPARGRRPRPQPAASSFFRSWMALPLALLVLAAVALSGVFFWFDDLLGGRPPAEERAVAEEELEPLAIEEAADHDPEGGDGEYPELVSDSFDGDRATAWQTEGYENQDMDKDGVGIFFDLGGSREIGVIRLRTNTPGWEFEVRGSDDEGEFSQTLSSTDGQTSFVTRGAVTTIELEPATYRYVLIWVTELGGDGPPYRATVAEIDIYPPA